LRHPYITHLPTNNSKLALLKTTTTKQAKAKQDKPEEDTRNKQSEI